MLGKPPFKTGDRVKLKSGNSRIIVTEVDYLSFFSDTPISGLRKGEKPKEGWYIRFMYASDREYSGWSRRWRRAEDFEYYPYKLTDKYQQAAKEWMAWFEDQPEHIQARYVDKEKIVTEQSKIYMTKEETPRYGKFLIKNSYGRMVLEMKGTKGEVADFDPSEIEEVMPYTVAIQRQEGSRQSEGEIRNYSFKRDSVAVDDILIHLSTGNLYKVVELDTKIRHPRASKNGFFKLQGQFLTVEN